MNTFFIVAVPVFIIFIYITLLVVLTHTNNIDSQLEDINDKLEALVKKTNDMPKKIDDKFKDMSYSDIMDDIDAQLFHIQKVLAEMEEELKK